MWKGEWKAYAFWWVGLPLIAAVVAVAAMQVTVRREGRQAAAAEDPEPTPYRHALFTMKLPAGWKLVRERERATDPGYDIVADAGGAARFEEGGGGYLEVVVPCPATDAISHDAWWKCDLDAAGGAIGAYVESPPCTREEQERCLADLGRPQSDNEIGCFCGAGDGALHVWAVAGAGDVCFAFGNARRETGVDLSPFRVLIGRFRATPGAPPGTGRR